MIEVINRELLIPREEYNIGTCYDDNTETRHFHLKRVTSGGVDLAALTFNLDILYANGSTDAASLLKEVTDKDINLVLTINNSMLQVPGTVLVQIRALDEDGVCKWTSYKSAFFVEDHINTPGHYEGDLTQLEQYETEWGKVRDNVNQLNLRMDEVVRIREESPATEVEEEVIDARIGADNVVYGSLGSAIRKQFENVYEAMEDDTGDWTEAVAAEATARQNADTAEATARQSADNTLQGNINSEASTRASADSNLQAQINQIVAPSGEAPSAAEVQNARIGADGVTYDTLGNAIRGQVNDLKSAFGQYIMFKFQRIAGVGQYWNNNVNIETKAGNTVRVTLDSYGGQYLNRLYIFGFYTENEMEEIGRIFNVGDAIEVVTTKNYVKYRFTFYTTQDDGAINASVLFASDNINGVGKDIINLQKAVTVTSNNLNTGRKWNQLVEIDNLSGVWANLTKFAKNGAGVTGYTTKVYDVSNVYKARFSGNPYNILGEKYDGTKVLLNYLFAFPATNTEFDVTEYKKIHVSGLASAFWGGWSTNFIKLEGYTKIDSKWNNREIVWFGTSIPAGGFKGSDQPLSYPFQVGRLLGATVYNEAVGDSGVHYRELSRVSATNPYGFNFYFISATRCLTNTIAMMQWLGNWADYYCNGGTYKNAEEWDATIFTSGLPNSWTDADTEAIKQFSYENKLDKYLTDSTFPDLFVFDHGYNDRIRWADNTGTYEAQLAEYGRDNCYTFRGAMNFLIDRIYSFNPRAKIIIIGDYENQSDEKKYDSTYQMRVADDYEIPIYKRWEYTGWSQVQETAHYTWSSGLLNYMENSTATKTLLAWALPDGIHPHSDLTGGAIRRMARLIAPFIDKLE